MRRVVAHHDHGRVIVALNQQARLFPDREGHRREHAGHALVTQPLFGPGDQRGSDIRVLGLKRAPEAGAGAHALLGRLGQGQLVDMGGDPAHHRSTSAGQEQLAAGMFEIGVAAGGIALDLLRAQLRHEIGIVGIETIDQVDKGLATLLVADFCDHNFRMGHDLAFVLSHQAAIYAPPHLPSQAGGATLA